jgi:pimeloyl-ACP methyl ester carboxylesterase
MSQTHATIPPSVADPHPRRSVGVLGTSMTYVDTGSGAPVVFLHGNPTSSYLWRNVIPHLSDAYRCLAPDLVGMGASGPASDGAYRFADHARYLDAWLQSVLPSAPVTLVLHDWGSALGFHWTRRNPERVHGIAYMEAIVQPRRWSDFPAGRDTMFRAMRSPDGESLVLDQNFFIETVLPKSVLRTLDEREMEAYRSPFRTRECGSRRWYSRENCRSRARRRTLRRPSRSTAGGWPRAISRSSWYRPSLARCSSDARWSLRARGRTSGRSRSAASTTSRRIRRTKSAPP